MPPLNMRAWDTLRFSTAVLSSIVQGIDEQIEAVEEIFLNQAGAA